jgi:GWxTD domain-containing protein
MKKIGLLILLGLITLSTSKAQFYESSRNSGTGSPYFEVELFRTFADDHQSTRVYVYADILYDDLTFIKETMGTSFKAQLELQMALIDKDDRQTGFKSITKTITETDYSATNSRERNVSFSHYFDVPYGEYQLKLKMNDEMSQKTTTGKLDLILTDYKMQKLALSDLLLLNDLKFDSTGKVISYIPRVKSNFPKKEGDFYIQFELFCQQFPLTANVDLELRDEKDRLELDSTMTINVQDTVTMFYFDIAKHQLKKNNYTCIVKAEAGKYKTESRKKISFYWVTLPETSEDITIALEQMRYILPADSLDRYAEAPLAEQQKFFSNFWARRDPNPDTKVNELMDEYFSRINYANREFTNFSTKGWLSDRGRIIIKFGYPDDIERHPFEISSSPYEVWRYYTLRRVFIFVDETGFGDYRLSPMSMNQEY